MNNPEELDKKTRHKIERELIACLTNLGVVTPTYSGEIIIHFSEGGVTDIDRFEKSLRRRLEQEMN